MLRGIYVTLALTAVFCVVLSSGASACDKKPVPVPMPCGSCECPPVPCCPQDSCAAIVVGEPAAVYTEAGLRTFAAIFSAAATKGVENATVRAFNATKACPPCDPCEKPKK